MEIPEYTYVREKDRKGDLLNPLEQFIRNNEPYGDDDDKDFRSDLQKLVNYLVNIKK
jgi:hypothetical protein